MAIALTMPLILSAVRALMRYRDRVDRVLSLSTATEGLPFALPPVPQDMKPFREEMRVFFHGNEGLTILTLHGLAEDFGKWDRRLTDGQSIVDPAMLDNFDKCTELYRRARNIGPYLLQPQLKDAAMLQGYAASGPGDDARLAYFIVESDRLTRNSSLSRLILITGDTLLELLGENANTFIANPRTRGAVETLIEEFAGKNDFDDESAREIFRQLLGAAVTAALDHTELLPNKPILAALYGAINDVRKEVKEKSGGNDTKAYDTIARLFGENGLERIGRFFMARVANEPSLVADANLARDAVKAALQELVAGFDAHGTFKGIFASQASRNRVLEALIEVGAGRAADLFKRKGADGKPFSATVLTALAVAVQTEASHRQLFADIAQGEIAGDLYAVALAAVAANAQTLANETGISPIVAELLAALAEQLERVPFGASLNKVARDKLVSTAFNVLAHHLEVLGNDRKFASTLIGAAIAAAAAGAADGFTPQDLEAIVDAALTAAGDNAALAGLSDSQAAVLKAVTETIAKSELHSLRTSSARKELLLGALTAIQANPKVWSAAQARTQLPPLIAAIISVMRAGHSRQLLNDSSMLVAFNKILLAASRRAKGIIARDGGSADLAAMLIRGLDLIEKELGRTVDQETIPAVLERIALVYCKAPFVVAQASQQTIDILMNEILDWLERQ